MNDGQWLLDLKKLESEYYKRRWNLRNKFKRFVRSNPCSERYTEDELIKDLQDMKEIRDSIKQMSKDHNFKEDNKMQYSPSYDPYSFQASRPFWDDYKES